MKCSQCAKSSFTSITILDNDGNRVTNDVRAFSCDRCGHIEGFTKTSSVVEEYDEKVRIAEENRKSKEKLYSEKKNQEYTLKRNQLLDIINDENQTVKNVNAAKNELDKLDKNHNKNPFGY